MKPVKKIVSATITIDKTENTRATSMKPETYNKKYTKYMQGILSNKMKDEINDNNGSRQVSAIWIFRLTVPSANITLESVVQLLNLCVPFYYIYKEKIRSIYNL